jgi:glyceraldehyde 3-phosphate dehydrogenase
MVVRNPPCVEQINAAMKLASETYLKGIMAYTEDPIVSVDVIGNPNSCLFDAELTSVVNNMIKVVGWYDNEAGYSNRLLDLMKRL